jgi:RHS repeat-associated protein
MDGDQPLTADSAGNTTFYLYGLGAIAEKTTAWSYSLPDGTNTPRQLSGPSGSITLSSRYTPWGDTLDTSGTGGFTFGYFGGVMDAATGLLYVGNGQYYDPATGRFLTRNVNPDNTNPYTPWNPIGAIIGPLGLISLFCTRRKKGSKSGTLLVLLLIGVTMGMTLAACVPGNVTVTVVSAPGVPIATATATFENGLTVTAMLPASGGAPTEVMGVPCQTIEVPTPTQTATPTPAPTILMRLMAYGVTLTNNPDAIWQETDATAVLLAVEAVAKKFASFRQTVDEFTAFQRAYGLLTFNKVASFEYKVGEEVRTITAGACACGGPVITVAGLARTGDYRDEQLAMELNRNNIVHELGHQFVRNWPEKVNDNANPNHPYNMYSSELLTEDGWPEPPIGAELMWRQHPSRMDGYTFDRGEVFADMFLGWVFGVYATGDEARIGNLRRVEMDRIMSIKLQELFP